MESDMLKADLILGAKCGAVFGLAMMLLGGVDAFSGTGDGPFQSRWGVIAMGVIGWAVLGSIVAGVSYWRHRNDNRV